MSKRLLTIIILSILVSNATVEAMPRIKITGRASILVTQPEVRMADIAEVQSSSALDDEAVIGIKKISISSAPKPGENSTISAHEIIGRLQEEGVNTNEVLYSLPRIMKAERASRAISSAEISNAIQNYIVQNGLSTEIKKLYYDKPIQISPGIVTLAVQSSVPTNGGQRSFHIAAMQDGIPSEQFDVSAQVQEFREIPVAKKAISRGSLLTDADIVMARFNVGSLPADAVQGTSEVIGQEVKNDISAGEVFRANRLSPPVVITAGSPVTMKFQGEFFEATASGTALESGGISQEIKVRNDASKKVIVGKVLEVGIVGVQ